VTIDLKTPEGVATARRLIASADVMIENFRPGALAEKGLDYASLAAVNPRLIYCSLKGFLSGPYETRTALDEVVQMMGGLAHMTGPVGRPLRAGAPVNDIMGGAFGAIAMLAALRQRERTGTGQCVQSGLFENCAYLVSSHMMQHAASGQEPVPMSAGKRAWGIYDIFESADGVKVFVGVVTERQWAIFTRILEEPELMDPAYATNNDRSRARDTLIPLVARLLAKRTIAEIERPCEAAGLPYARITTPSDLFEDAHLNAGGGMLPLMLPDGRETRVPGLPIQFGSSRLGLRSQPPGIGEHNDEVLGPLVRSDITMERADAGSGD
jgi:crotonobetainyl-CoA:carnitine CoA-transferase CaiB-like acyl-CoA transferase